MNKIEIHGNLCDILHQTYVNKNSDYGDSFARVREKYPTAILIRLNDKLNRLETLMSDAVQKVNDESIDDTLLDFANYALMELTERQTERSRLAGTIRCSLIDKDGNCAASNRATKCTGIENCRALNKEDFS